VVDEHASISCSRENSLHYCSLNYLAKKTPIKKGCVSLCSASISDMLFLTHGMREMGEYCLTGIGVHHDKFIYREDHCYGRTPYIPYVFLKEPEYVFREWLKESFSKIYRITKISSSHSWDDAAYRPNRWHLKCQYRDSVFILKGYGSFRVLYLLFQRLAKLIVKSKKMPVNEDYTCGDDCSKCTSDELVAPSTVVELAAGLLLRSVSDTVDPYHLQCYNRNDDHVCVRGFKFCGFDGLGHRGSDNAIHFDTLISYIVNPLSSCRSKKYHAKMIAALISVPPNDLVQVALSYSGKCINYYNILKYSEYLTQYVSKMFTGTPISLGNCVSCVEFLRSLNYGPV